MMFSCQKCSDVFKIGPTSTNHESGVQTLVVSFKISPSSNWVPSSPLPQILYMAWNNVNLPNVPPLEKKKNTNGKNRWKTWSPQTFQKVKEVPNKNCGSFVPHLLYHKQESKQLKRYSQERFVVSRHFQKKARHAEILFFCIAKFIIYRWKSVRYSFHLSSLKPLGLLHHFSHPLKAFAPLRCPAQSIGGFC